MAMNNMEKIEIIREALGEASGLFMIQDCRATEIIMPTEELERISQETSNKINVLEKKEGEKIVTLYMKALGETKLPEKVWKQIARVNQIVLDNKLSTDK